jgi:hypothetical protein
MVRCFLILHFALGTKVLLFSDVKIDIIVGFLEKNQDYWAEKIA